MTTSQTIYLELTDFLPPTTRAKRTRWDLWHEAEGCPLSPRQLPLEGAASSLRPETRLSMTNEADVMAQRKERHVRVTMAT